MFFFLLFAIKVERSYFYSATYVTQLIFIVDTFAVESGNNIDSY